MKILIVNRDALLPGDEGKARAQLQQEGFHCADALHLQQLQKFALDRTAQVKVGTQKQAVEKQQTAGIEKQRNGLDKPAKVGKEKGKELPI